VTAPLTRRSDFNDADLRYLRRALPALREAHKASDMATAFARDPRVRTLARRARARQAHDIRAVTSMLLGSAPHKGSPDQAGAATPGSSPSRDLGSLAGLGLDRRFIEVLTAHAEASLASARTEMIEGFDEACRRHAEDATRASQRQLAVLSLLAPTNDDDQASASPAPVSSSRDRKPNRLALE
jgi:uncharacterized protein (DUF305 family)